MCILLRKRSKTYTENHLAHHWEENRDTKDIPPSSIGLKEKMYAFPAPSVHHRHRSISAPLYSPEGRVERLDLVSSNLTFTTSFTERPKRQESSGLQFRVRSSMGPSWMNTCDTRKPLLWGTTLILRRSVGLGFIPIYVFKMVGDDELGVCTLFVCKITPYIARYFLNFCRAASPCLPTDDEGDLKTRLCPVSLIHSNPKYARI